MHYTIERLRIATYERLLTLSLFATRTESSFSLRILDLEAFSNPDFNVTISEIQETLRALLPYLSFSVLITRSPLLILDNGLSEKPLYPRVTVLCYCYPSPDEAEIPRMRVHFPLLNVLKLRYMQECRQLATSHEFVQKLSDTFPKLSFLKIEMIRASSIVYLTEHCTSLRHLDLAPNTDLNDEALHAIMKHSQSLVYLNLTWSRQGVMDGPPPRYEILAEGGGCQKLEYLTLAQNTVSAASLTFLLQNLSGLKYLDLCKTNLESDAIQTIARYGTRLLGLNLAHQSRSCKDLVEVAENCKRLVKAIWPGCPSNKVLQKMLLECKDVQDVGFNGLDHLEGSYQLTVDILSWLRKNYKVIPSRINIALVSNFAEQELKKASRFFQSHRRYLGFESTDAEALRRSYL